MPAAVVDPLPGNVAPSRLPYILANPLIVVFPFTSSLVAGLVVPIPTLPVE